MELRNCVVVVFESSVFKIQILRPFLILEPLIPIYYKLGFSLIVNDYLGFFRDSNSQLFGDYSIYLLGINDYLDDYLGKKVTIRENPIQLGDLWSI